MPFDLLFVLEPTLGLRDRHFFQLAATLIPIFFLAGAVSSAARVPRDKVWPRPSHLWLVLCLAVFVVVEVIAELTAIAVLVSGSANDWDRFVVLVGLLLAIFGAAVTLVGPWVRHFYRSGDQFRQGAWGLGIGGAAVLIALAWGTYNIFNSTFEVTRVEVELREIERAEEEGRLAGPVNPRLSLEESKELLRLRIRYEIACRKRQRPPVLAEERPRLKLLEIEILGFIGENDLLDELNKKDGQLAWLDGCKADA